MHDFFRLDCRRLLLLTGVSATLFGATLATAYGQQVLHLQPPPGAQGTTGGHPTRIREDTEQFIEIADDFIVPDTTSGWTLQKVRYSVSYFGGVPDPNLHDVHIYPDHQNAPAATPVCSYQAIPGQRIDAGGIELDTTVVLPTDCPLPPGHYWIGYMPRTLSSPPSTLIGYLGMTTAVHSGALVRSPSRWLTNCEQWQSVNDCLTNLGGGSPVYAIEISGLPTMTSDVIFADGFDAATPAPRVLIRN